MIFDKRRTMLLATLFMVCSFVVLQTACQDPEAVRKQTEAEAVAAWNQSQLEKEKAIQAQRDIEIAKARQAAIDAQNSAEWRDLIWKISQWVLGILIGVGAVFFGLMFWKDSVTPVITKRQELQARLKDASVYAASERAKTEEAKAETARAKRAEDERKTKQAEAARAQDQKRIEELKAKQLAEPRKLEEAKAQQAEDARREKEAAAVIAQRGIEEAKTQRVKAEAKKAEEERRTEEAKAKQAEEWRLGEEAKAKQGEEWRLAEEAKAKQVEEWRLGEEANARQIEDERREREAEAVIAQGEIEVAKASQAQAEAKKIEDKRLTEEAKTEQARLKTEQQQQALALKEAEAVIAQRKAKEAEAQKAEEVRLAEEAKAKQAEEKRLAEQAKRVAQELAKQNKLESYPLLDHTETFLKRLDELPSTEIKGDKERTLFELYLKLKEVLEKTGKVKLARKAELAQDAIRLHQIESLLDLYDEKIQRVRVDDGLGEDDREEKVIYWKSLRDRQVAEIQGH